MKYSNKEIIPVLLLLLFVIKANLAKELVLDDYFPLQYGNQWEFQTIPADTNLSLKWCISDTVKINGIKYYLFNGIPIRKDSVGNILEYRDEGEIVWFTFYQNEDYFYTFKDYPEWEYVVKITKNITASCALGEFENSIYFDFFLPDVVDANYNYYFAPNIGPIRYWTSMNPYELCRATINGREITQVSSKHQMPGSFDLEQNFPNPFNHSTQIKFSIKDNTYVIIEIYDIRGNEIETLLNGYLKANQYTVIWNASNHPSGQYLVCLTANGHRKIIKSINIK